MFNNFVYLHNLRVVLFVQSVKYEQDKGIRQRV